MEHFQSANQASPNWPINHQLQGIGMTEEELEMDIQGIASELPSGPDRDLLIKTLRETCQNMPVVVLGEKPTSEKPQLEVYFLDIPESKLGIRLFPGGALPAQGVFFFDFVNRENEQPVNAPKDYTVYQIEGGQQIKLSSVEEIYGVASPGAGLEKFAIMENAVCCLVRPGQPAFHYRVPLRNRGAGPPMAQFTRIS